MKFHIFFVFSLFIFNSFIYAQPSYGKHVIDSLKKNVLNSKTIDSLGHANAHYRIGELYRYSTLNDSAYYHYYKAEKAYRKIGNNFQLAKTLYGISAILTYEKYYSGAEAAAFEALKLLDVIKSTDNVNRYKSFIYNNLGVVFQTLEEFDQAIIYHKKGLNLKEALHGDNKTTIDNSKNNLANTYKNAGKYRLATEWFSNLLEDKSLLESRPDFYGLLLDNYAHTLFMAQSYSELPNLYHRALRICDSINNVSSKYNSISINQNIAEYYNFFNQKDSAKYYAYKAKEIAEEYANDDLLISLKLLSRIEDDSIAVKHYKSYITLNDSLQKSERSIGDKFARIRFETNQIEQENIKIARERMWLIIISLSVITASVLLYIVINQRNKNKELKFIQQQQETNEEIYNLMLSQQDNIDEARIIEKKRISEELHDGVLGRLFGTRLSLDSLNMGTTKEAIETRSQYISELKIIEEDIRKVSHELNTDFVAGSGFSDIITGLVESQTLVYELKYKLHMAEAINWDGVSNKDKIHVYRIIQEALHNIYKHAKATKVNISFKLKNSVIWLKIKDDGVGFDVSKAKSGIGLKNMNSRIKEINGTIQIESKIEKGTTVTIEIPTT